MNHCQNCGHTWKAGAGGNLEDTPVGKIVGGILVAGCGILMMILGDNKYPVVQYGGGAGIVLLGIYFIRLGFQSSK